MKRAFKTRHFSRWARKATLPDAALCKAVDEMTQGLIDADLGGGVIKKRVPLPGRGKSGSTRTLVATNKGERWFFVFGFEKNERANISAAELEALQKIAADLLKRSANDLNALIQLGKPPAMPGDSVRFDRSGGHQSKVRKQHHHSLPLAGGGVGRG